jgi:hypothetical protein
VVGVAACGDDRLGPVSEQQPRQSPRPDAEPRQLSADEILAFWPNPEDLYIEYEVGMAGGELIKCMTDAGEDEAKRASCMAAHKARIDHAAMVVEKAQAEREKPARR